jgi:hypothetical protein
LLKEVSPKFILTAKLCASQFPSTRILYDCLLGNIQAMTFTANIPAGAGHLNVYSPIDRLTLNKANPEPQNSLYFAKLSVK